jgi:hypothetical protein
VIKAEPVAWWPLDADLDDRIGARPGTIGAGSEVHAGSLPVDHGASFNCAGTNWISVAHAAALKPAVGSFMVWFRPQVLGDFWIANCDETGATSNNFALTTLATGLISAYWQVGGVHTELSTTSAYYTAGQVVHAICTWDGSGVALYLDGNRIGTDGQHVAGLNGNVVDWHFGHSQLAGGEIFDGMIDEIAIWDRVLTRNEVYLLSQTEPS